MIEIFIIETGLVRITWNSAFFQAFAITDTISGRTSAELKRKSNNKLILRIEGETRLWAYAIPDTNINQQKGLTIYTVPDNAGI